LKHSVDGTAQTEEEDDDDGVSELEDCRCEPLVKETISGPEPLDFSRSSSSEISRVEAEPRLESGILLRHSFDQVWNAFLCQWQPLLLIDDQDSWEEGDDHQIVHHDHHGHENSKESKRGNLGSQIRGKGSSCRGRCQESSFGSLAIGPSKSLFDCGNLGSLHEKVVKDEDVIDTNSHNDEQTDSIENSNVRHSKDDSIDEVTRWKGKDDFPKSCNGQEERRHVEPQEKEDGDETSKSQSCI